MPLNRVITVLIYSYYFYHTGQVGVANQMSFGNCTLEGNLDKSCALIKYFFSDGFLFLFIQLQ